MRIKPELQLKQTQKLIMTPQLQQSIKMLQLSTVELRELIEKELAENPALEVEEKGQALEVMEREIKNVLDEDKSDKLEDFDNTEDFEEYYLERRAQIGKSNDEEDTKRKFLEGAISREETLQEYLLTQLNMIDEDEEIVDIATILVSYLDSMGYLSVSLEELSKELDIPLSKLEKALKIIHSLDPPGVGARDVRECLLIQLDNIEEKGPVVDLAKKIVEESLNDLKLHKINEIARKHKVKIEDVREAVNLIEKLEPYPGRQYYTGEIRYIIPDVIVVKKDGDFEVVTNETVTPKLRINRYYERLLKSNETDKKTKEFIAEKVQRAKNFINSINQRETTLVRVMKAILEEQKEFFEKGPKYLKPLTLKDIAAKLDLHESTISRITSSKYVQTPFGIFQLKYFFSNPIKSSSNSSISSRSIKEMIKEIIEEEGEKKHLSDQKIADLLAKKGIKIARRTVAKYRKELNILPSKFRR